MDSRAAIALAAIACATGCPQLEFTPDDRSDRTPEWDGPGEAVEAIDLQGGEIDARIVGAQPAHRIGEDVAAAGDLDGDGHEDFLVTSWETPGRSVHVVLGPLQGDVEVSTARAQLTHDEEYAFSGWSLLALGDQDGDGLDDFAVGGPGYGPEGPEAFVRVFLDLPAGKQPILETGFGLLEEEHGSGVGASLVHSADLTGDGTDDLLIGATLARETGAVYVWPGPVTAPGALADADAILVGAAEGCIVGRSALALGDTDGDGLGEVIVGETAGEGAVVHAYLVAGPMTGELDLPEVAEAVLVGAEHGGWSEMVLAGGEDLDGDGVVDVVAAQAPHWAQWADDELTVHLLRGPLSGEVSLETADAVVTWEDVHSSLRVLSLVLIADRDGDGLREIALGLPMASNELGHGITYLIEGDLQGSWSIEDAGSPLTDDLYSGFGHGFARVGDTHLLVGAPHLPVAYLEAGAAYLIRVDSLQL